MKNIVDTIFFTPDVYLDSGTWLKTPGSLLTREAVPVFSYDTACAMYFSSLRRPRAGLEYAFKVFQGFTKPFSILCQIGKYNKTSDMKRKSEHNYLPFHAIFFIEISDGFS